MGVNVLILTKRSPFPRERGTNQKEKENKQTIKEKRPTNRG
jgi:hypothetical protein